MEQSNTSQTMPQSVQMSPLDLQQRCLKIAKEQGYKDWMIEAMLVEPEIMDDMIRAKNPTRAWFMTEIQMY